MVKITNTLGDVKVGKQGAAVYQRKYGQQVRRTRQPKRAIVSQTQLAHRQLYRAALDWRKQLSLPNRRYLDGYTIANWIVDNYKIPLPWSRFALKLYLEHVHFVVMEKPTTSYEMVEQKFEAYDNEADLTSFDAAWGNYCTAQTFTPQATHDLKKIMLYVAKLGSPGLATASIRATDGVGKPTGEDLVSETFNVSNLETTMTWKEILLPYSELVAETQYAIVLKLPTGNGTNYIKWGMDNTAPTYARGVRAYSTTGGATWILSGDKDMGFSEYGEYEVSSGEPGLLHVRHPALLSVVHKRGALLVSQYANLSSLDEEYLTGQVGLDVESGDTIKVTTLPGIEYNYLVV